jgi:methanogenic corrinoid protein MtbC1
VREIAMPATDWSESAKSTDGAPSRGQSHHPNGLLATLCYRSRAVERPNGDDLADLLGEARARNRRFGVTGMLICEGDRYFQWLEGPDKAVGALWDAIRRDERHHEIEVLGEGVTPTRLFSEWDLRFHQRSPDDVQSDTCDVQTTAAEAQPEKETSAVEADDASCLARLALEGDEAAMAALMNQWRGGREDPRELCRSLLEPAALRLGDWWCQDRCSSFEISIALSTLQNLVRRLQARWPTRSVAIEGRHILVSPPPKETHMLGVTVLGGLFRQAGWRVRAEFPQTDEELTGLVSTHWFDALALTLSDVFTRQERLAALVKTIVDVRVASRNPAIAVIVGGRAFRTGQTAAPSRIGADVHYSSASDAVGDLDCWLFMHRFTQEKLAGQVEERSLAGLKPLDIIRKITPALARNLGLSNQDAG